MENILRAIAVDDEDISLNRICRLIRENPNLELVACYTDPQEALKNIAKDMADVAFLDIEMPNINGLELADRIANENHHAELIFVTAFDKYALQAFQAHAIGYLLKPVEQEQINEEVSRLLHILNRPKVEKETQKLYLRCFGGFECSLNNVDGEKILFRTAKALELIAYLHDKQGEFVSSDKIMEELWPHMDAKRAADNFHTTTYYVRKTLSENRLPDVMVYKRGGYALKIENVQSDLKEFLSCKQLENSSKCYKGIYLEGKDYHWAVEKRLKLEMDFEYTQLNLAEKYAKDKKYSEALHVLRNLIVQIPFSEEANKKLMILYMETGQRHLAVKAYKTYAAILKKEYGVKPSDEIKNIFK